MATLVRMLHKKDNKVNGLRAAYSATGAISLLLPYVSLLPKYSGTK
jgi:hypothetical protein